MNDYVNKVFNEDALSGLKKLPDDSVDCQVCSPPYLNLRSYGVPDTIWGGKSDCEHEWQAYIKKGTTGGTATTKLKTHGQENFQIVPDSKQESCFKCGAWKGCLGAEPEVESFVFHLCDIFDEVKRVLKPSGTNFVNLSDTYLGSGKGVWKGREKANKESFQFDSKPKEILEGWKKPKQLALVPFRFAIEMQNRGWLLRNVLIWEKPNSLPSSTKDRWVVSHEYIFFFTKQSKYYFKQLLEPFAATSKPDEIYTGKATKDYDLALAQNPSDTKRRILESMRKRGGRSARTVLRINTKPSKTPHTATFPLEIPKRCIEAGCPEKGLVMDIFMGTGTTAFQAKQMGRNYTGFELNSEYCKIIEERLKDTVLEEKKAA